ncbi:hypothetical protein CLOM_g2061 [Closterium sp. NIES-68]|nr:hypothetical protein CLOM_g20735 [Closterium sp. NIES-68]GJP42508.1 hypothetical protein CLOM_g2061 [Closterium sp. NIES-68]
MPAITKCCASVSEANPVRTGVRIKRKKKCPQLLCSRHPSRKLLHSFASFARSSNRGLLRLRSSNRGLLRLRSHRRRHRLLFCKASSHTSWFACARTLRGSLALVQPWFASLALVQPWFAFSFASFAGSHTSRVCFACARTGGAIASFFSSLARTLRVLRSLVLTDLRKPVLRPPFLGPQALLAMGAFSTA